MATSISALSGTWLKAAEKASAPAPAYPDKILAAASAASSLDDARTIAKSNHRSATSQVVASLPSGQSKPTTHSSAS
ncbi:hypothetical protein AB0M20_07910 [Actinoplanes sp. NPDC051633]|uniref:hypothetical protein n=1 Tax=Actinoplanes sp. NPDC051633 TaxID=3155670 RepID=UPI003443173A